MPELLWRGRIHIGGIKMTESFFLLLWLADGRVLHRRKNARKIERPKDMCRGVRVYLQTLIVNVLVMS
jgi:hypothetical protein